MTFPFDEKPPSVLFLEAIALGHTDKAAAGLAGWTIEEAENFKRPMTAVTKLPTTSGSILTRLI